MPVSLIAASANAIRYAGFAYLRAPAETWRITGDFSWLHVNEFRAKDGHFKTRIVHGMLLLGLVSTVVGNQMPGAGTIYESQSMRFIRPCYINDTVRAQAEVVELMPAGRVRLKTTCFNQHG